MAPALTEAVTAFQTTLGVKPTGTVDGIAHLADRRTLLMTPKAADDPVNGRNGLPTRAVTSVDIRLVRVTAASGGAFAVLAALVWTGWDRLVAFDRRWSARAFDFMLGHQWCETISRIATWMAGGLTITVLTGIVVLICVGFGHRLLAVWLAVTVAGSAIANTLVKAAMEQTRPPTANLETSAHGFAFPSGHTQAATVTYVAVVLVVGWQIWRPARWLRRVSVVGVVVLVASVGLSRILLGAHWPSDVLGGWLIGAAWVTAATVALNRWPSHHAGSPIGRPRDQL